MKRIKENEIKEILKIFNHKNLKIDIRGAILQECLIENAEISFLDNQMQISIKDNKNKFLISLCYIETIYFIEKNKLKFLMSSDLEILIIFL